MGLDLGRGQVAQLVEQGIENPRVGSSILSLATIFFKGLEFNGSEPFLLLVQLRKKNLLADFSMLRPIEK